MSTTAVLLLIVSAVLHASWNLLCKRSTPSAAFLLVANTLGCLILVPVVLARGSLYGVFSPFVWKLVVLTGLFQAAYYAALAGAYRAGDMSLVYPLARSAPAVLVLFVALMMGRGEAISSYCVCGILLVVGGCFLLPMRAFTDFRIKNYASRTSILAMLAAAGTAGYTLVDGEALAVLRQQVADTRSIVAITVLFALMEAVAASLWLSLYVLGRKSERTSLIRVLKTNRRAALLAGVGIYVTFTLVLVSMSWVKDVSYVAGFRQLSIPLGAVMGSLILGESMSRPKALGLVILSIGLFLIAVG